LLKRRLDKDFGIGMDIENIQQVFHRILDLKHRLGFYPGFFVAYDSFRTGINVGFYFHQTQCNGN
jgi:hypothetical protein